MVAQAAVGYTQYFSGDPAGLVALHVAGACILLVAVLRFHLGLGPILRLMCGPRRRAPTPSRPCCRTA